MKTTFKPIKLNDKGGNVSVLHQVLGVLKFPVNQTEVASWKAGRNTLKQVRELQKTLGLRVTANSILMDEKTINAIIEVLTKKELVSAEHSFNISGEVKVSPNLNNLNHRKNQRLLALDVDLRGAAVYRNVKSLQEAQKSKGFEFLGEAVSNSKGLYELQLFDWQYIRTEYKKADIIVYAVNEKDQIIGRSNLVHTSGNDNGFVDDLDIVITSQDKRSEYQTLMEVLQVFLKQNNVKFDEISRSNDQLDFTANELDIDRNNLGLITSAGRVVSEESTLSHKLSHQLLYGIARQEVALDWRVLYKQTEQDLLKVITASATANIIDENVTTDEALPIIKEFVAAVKAAAIKHLIDDSDDDGKNPLNDMLTISLSLKKQRLAYLKAVADFKGEDFDEFWTTHLPLQPEFRGNEALVAAVKVTHQLTALTGNHLPLVKELQTKLKVSSAQALIDLSHDDWLKVIKKSGVPTFVSGKDDDEKQQNYAQSLQNQLNLSFPMLRIANMVKDNLLGINKVSIAKGVTAFLTKHENFSYAHSRIDKFQQEIDQESTRVEAAPEEIKSELLKQQRVFQISTDPKVMSVLSKNNLDSAHKVAAIPRANFINTYAKVLGGNQKALKVHQRAELITARAESIAVELKQYAGESATPQKIMSGSDKAVTQAILSSELPNYKNLFGNPELCECQHCRSVFSPAAYFVELLRFLQSSTFNIEVEGGVIQSRSPYDYLVGKRSEVPEDAISGRRPDLIELALSCENTNTLTPYIDLANEVMEFYVANESLNSYTGENTGDTIADELRANPQYTNIDAYEILSDNIETKPAKYPFDLPFHQPLSVIRTYSNYLNVSRYQVMQDVNPTPIDETMRAISAEALALSQEEYSLLVGEDFEGTAENTHPHEKFGYSDADNLEHLSKVPEFLSRSGVTYVELVELIKTRFINPHQDTLDYLTTIILQETLESNNLFAQLKNIRELGTLDQVNDADIIATLNAKGIDESVFVTWVVDHFHEFQQTITLFEPSSKCDIDTTRLRTIEGIYEDLEHLEINVDGEEELVLGESKITSDQWLRFHTFIRLWRKTGWSIHETDLMLNALGEDHISPATVEKLESVLLLKKASRLPLEQLAVLWGDIDTYGKNSLYKKLFLNKAAQKIDTVFVADAQGNYLDDITITLVGHQSTLLAAFRISECDLTTILVKAALVSDKLNLQNLSAIYRYVVLAKALKITVTDLCKMIDLFDARPFITPVSPSDTYKFYQLAVSTKDMKFKPAALEYIFTGDLPVDSKQGLKPENILQTGKSIRDSLAIIEQTHPLTPETTLTSEIVAGKLSISFQPEVVSQFMEIVQGSAIFSIKTETNIGVVMPEDLKEKYSYIEASGRLICKGNMLDSERLDLIDLLGVNQENAINELFNTPAIFINDAFKDVFDLPAKLDLMNEKLLDRPVNNPAISLETKLEYIYISFLPFIIKRLKEEVVTVQIADLVGLSEVATRLLMSDHIESLVIKLSAQGFSASYFNNTTFDGPAEHLPLRSVDNTIDFTWIKAPSEERNLPVNDSFSARWKAYIAAPSSGQYTLIVEVTESDEAFSLYLDGALLLDKEIGTANTKLEILIDLNTAQLHRLVLEYVENSGGAGVRLFWKTATSAPEIIPARVAYPADILDAFVERANTLHRAAAFITGFNLSESELNHFVNYNDDFDDINFEALTAAQWIRIRNYTQLRNSVPQAEALLTDIFTLVKQANPLPADEELLAQVRMDLIDKIYQVTAWDKVNIGSLIQHFLSEAFDTSIPPSVINTSLIVDGFKDEILLNQFNSVMKLVTRSGVAVKAIAEWGAAETGFDALHVTAQLLKNTVKAKYDDKAWLEIAGGLSDKIRAKQQQALISYLLVQPLIKEAQVTDADGLFEHLLIDVQMGACMATSRIVQANAAIQLFVGRILLNLETNIPPDCIDTDRWSWMKNYRVWEANRKVFLYPENWLAPEWRNDRSEFFKELESHLLQNDITERSVEQGLRNYLMSMNEVANLDVCGMHQENDEEGKLKFLHVFGRTHNMPYKYFYRRWNEYQKWSAWEKVQLDIRGVEDAENSGVHLIPLVWKGRLYLFWPEFMEKAEESSASNGLSYRGREDVNPSALTPNKYWEVHLAWSEYVDEAWTPKQVSKEKLKIKDGVAGVAVNPSDIRISIYFDNEINNLIFIVDAYGVSGRQYFIITDIHSPIENGSCLLEEWQRRTGDESFYTKLKYKNKTLQIATNTYLKTQNNYQILKENSLLNPSVNPVFFYAESDKTYFSSPYPLEGINYIKPRLLIENTTNLIRSDNRGTPSSGISTVMLKNNDENWHNNFGDVIYAPPEPLPLPPENDSNAMPCRYANIVAHGQSEYESGLIFHTFHHPFSSKFSTRLNQGGISALLNTDTEDPSNDDTMTSDGGDTFNDRYLPDFDEGLVKPHINALGKRTYYQESICFDPLGANSPYNWELFFHAPLYIATRLSKNGKYEEAMKWFHYIFDPTTNEKPDINDANETSRYWRVRPFKTTAKETLEDYFSKLNSETAGGGPDIEYSNAVKEWRENPFDPHLVASNRPIAYMKHIVAKYIENLIDWGDSLFRKFTRESVYEAIQLYVIASHVLGKRPEFVPKRGLIKSETYASLKDKFDDFGNALVELENIFPYSSSVNTVTPTPGSNLLGIGQTLYFCIPANDKLLEYWDTVTDRLFKIRHCQDLDGVERGLALFAPVIDPAALIQARSQGLNLGDILADLSSPAPIYRFGYLLQKANEFCNDVKSLGSAMLSAIEKKDGEELSRLRASQESDMLERVTAIRERQVLSAKASIESLLKSRETAEIRLEHYNTQLLGNDSITVPDSPSLDASLTANNQLPGDTSISLIDSKVDMSLVGSGESGVKVIPREDELLFKNQATKWMNAGISSSELLASMMSQVPDTTVFAAPLGVGGSTDIGGGSKWANSIHLAANAARGYSGFLSSEASQASIMAGYIRRTYDWTLQANLVIREIIQLDKQITSADIQLQVAEKELQNHQQQIENSKQVELFLKDKFSNQELYQWMKEQLFTVYKQSYNLAFEMAKKAEKACQYELGTETRNFIQYGYWDSSMHGLVAGYKLQLGLRQLENSYINNNRRELELSKNISVAILNPLALIELRETGTCHLSLPEELFDLDFQGHYFRRIKAVSLSIPCIAGPYTSVNCSLRLIKNSIRKNTLMNPGFSGSDEYEHDNDEGLPLDDDRFRSSNVPVSMIATSTGQNDAGMFEFNFNDARCLPFEGAGVISDWLIELAGGEDLRLFDHETISDVVVGLKYTARENSGRFKEKALTHITNYIAGKNGQTSHPLMQILSIKHDFANEWHRFLQPESEGRVQVLNLTIGKQRFPFFTQGRDIMVRTMDIFVKSNNESIKLDLSQSASSSLSNIELHKDPKYGKLLKADLIKAELDQGIFELNIEQELSLKLLPSGTIIGDNSSEVEEMYIVLHYNALLKEGEN